MIHGSDAPWFVRTFGALEIRGAGGPAKLRTKKTAGILALLAVRGTTPTRRETLAAYSWPDSPSEAARQSLRMALSDIRAVLGETAIEGDRELIQINPRQVACDVALFEELTLDARYGEALELVTGPFLPDLDADWVAPEWFRIQDGVVEATCRYLDQCFKTGEYADGIRMGKRILAIIGCREDLHIGLMKLFVAQGTPSLAIAQFETLEKELDELWGEYPSQAAIDVLESAPRTRPVRTEAAHPTVRYHLIGRDDLLTQTADALMSPDGPRHITLIGPGGSGKTSLASGILQELCERSDAPNWFVDLTAETSSEGAARQIQTKLGLPHAEQSEAVFAIARHLRAKPGVLVLDNYEQLAASASSLVADLMNQVPDARFLVTSRVALQNDKEELLQVGPLDLPEQGATLEQIRRSAAIELFERQAQLANPRFSITPDNANAVVELCRQLDGLPLAIELAAARTIVRSPAQILASLHLSLESIASRKRHANVDGEAIRFSETDREVRHSSLTRTIEWSFDLLTEEEKQVCLAASLFVGRFSERDVQFLTPELDASEILGELVRASMLNADSTGAETQFWMFETLRQYMQETLEDREDRNAVRTRFLEYFSHRATSIDEDKGLTHTERMTQHWMLMPNYLASLEFGVGTQTLPEVTAELVANSFRTASVYGLTQRMSGFADAIRGWKQELLPPVLRAQILEAWILLTANTGVLEEQLAAANEGLALSEGDQRMLCRMHLCRGSLLKQLGKYDEATPDFEWAYQHAAPGDHDLRAKALYDAGLNLCCVAKYQESLELHEQALKEARKGDDPNLLIRILFDVGSEMAHLGRGEESMPIFDEAVERCLQLDSRKMEGLTRWQQGDAYLSMGQPQEALNVLKKAIQLVVDAGFSAGLKWVFLDTGEALAGCGNEVLAARVLGKAVETRIAENRPLAAYEQEDLDRVRLTLKSAIGEQGLERHWDEGAQEEWTTLIRQVMEFRAI